MKLNHDCIRDLMLFAEETLNMSNFIRCSGLQFNKYTNDELIYTTSKLIEAGYIEGKFNKYIDGERDAIITSITWSGHEFLDTIRDEGVWKTTKEKLNKFSSVPIKIISTVASQILTNLINQQLGL